MPNSAQVKTKYGRKSGFLERIVNKKYQIYFKVFGFQTKRRTSEFVKNEYCVVWKDKQQKLYDFALDPGYVEKDGHILLQTALENRRIQLEELTKIIRSAYPKNVLEIGAGSGLNLICLALLFPEIKFSGIELTNEGKLEFEKLIANPPMKTIQYLIGMCFEKIPYIDFKVGNMLALPFGDKAFDLIYSCEAIEQIPQEYKRVFKEVKRVAREWCVFYEGFGDFQNFFQKIWRKKLDYFVGETVVLRRLGFKIISVRIPFGHIMYNNAFVVCKIVEPP